MSTSSPVGAKPLLATTLKQTQRLIMSPQMQQAIQLLQVPTMELAAVIELEMEQNPLLEYIAEEQDEQEAEEKEPAEETSTTEEEEAEKTEPEVEFNSDDFSNLQDLEDEFGDHWEQSGIAYGANRQETEKLHNFLENSITNNESLFEHLTCQAHETFNQEHKLVLAEAIIGNIDRTGYLKTSLEEIAALNQCSIDQLEKILLTIQTFDPVGVGARTPQEVLLIQLRMKGKESSLAYQIVKGCYRELLHNQIPAIAQTLKCSTEEVNQAISNEISVLDLHPGLTIGRTPAQPIIADAAIRQDQDKLIVSINDEHIPALKLNRTYLKMLQNENLPPETKEFIHRKILSAKWLFKNILQRNDTIEKIVGVLAVKQRSFFMEPTGELQPLTMHAVADELGIHESTVARAVANKYVETPRGLLPLRYFFTNAYITTKGDDISSETVKRALKEVIDNEDKSKPLSDNALSNALEKKGIHCARRTIAKYRSLLEIGNALQRKKY